MDDDDLESAIRNLLDEVTVGARSAESCLRPIMELIEAEQESDYRSTVIDCERDG